MAVKSLSRILFIAVLIVMVVVIAINHMELVSDGKEIDRSTTNVQKMLRQDDQSDQLYDKPTAEPFHNNSGSVVHLAFVVKDVTPLVTQVLKSVLIYRHCPLHFHFVVDSDNHYILEKLFKTWELPYVDYSLYTTDYIRSKLTLRSTLQSNKVLNISILLLPYILPQTIDNVIVLAPNVLVVSDIYQLWHLTLQLNVQNKLFSVSMLPSSGGRYNTNVMLMNLRLMRSLNWNQLWRSVITNLPNTNYVTHDVINSFITTYPDSTSVLPCLWSIDHQNQLTCSPNIADYYLLHLDSITLGSEAYQSYLKSMDTFVREYNSVRLRHVTFSSVNKSGYFIKIDSDQPSLSLSKLKKSKKRMCKTVREVQQKPFITHLYYYGIKHKRYDYYDTTLVSQLSLDRLDTLTLLLNHWEGPMSITMYGDDDQAWNLTKLLKKEFNNRDNLVFHIVYKEGWFYPINYLRNLALDSVSTRYVFLNDGDFLPSFELFEHLKKANKALLTGYKKRALIIPAFLGMKGFIYPSSKKELLDTESITQVCALCPHRTHEATNYSVWATAEHPYKVEWAYPFEPYVVVDRNVPRYDERFVGYGWNKISFIATLKAENYEFIVLPNVFIIHSPHELTSSKLIWKKSHFKFCIDSLWEEFKEDLFIKYGADCLNQNNGPPLMLDNYL